MTGTTSVYSFAKHVGKSILCYRLSALFLIVGVVLATVDIPFALKGAPAASAHRRDIPSGMTILWDYRFDIGKPPSSIFHLILIATAGQFVVLGVFWDVRRRAKEWALIRLYGGYPSLFVGLQVFCLSLVGALVGGGFPLLIGPWRSLRDAALLMSATVVWGLLFSGCLSMGAIAYTEFCDVAAILQVEG